MAGESKHALVFGASGLIGWGVVDQLLSNYPAQGIFTKVTALVNRHIDVRDSFWPEQSSATPELQLVSGVNLVDASVESLTKILRSSVTNIESVTHVFYFVYKSEDEPEEEVRVNCKMLECAIGTLNELCPKLEFVVFPSGTKAYGIHIPGGMFTAPYEESMGALPEEHEKNINYPALRNILEKASTGKQWTWCDIRPDAVIGFTPNGSAFSLTAHWATYLSLYALVQGKGAKILFPGTLKAYNSLYNEASACTVAKFAIWASLHPDRTGKGEIFNIADQSKAESMKERWPALATYFGLEGTPPIENDNKERLQPSEYIKKHYNVLEKHGVKSSPVFRGDSLDSYGYYLDFDRQLSLEKVKKAGFEEEKDPNESWFEAFDRFKRAGMIVG